MMKTFFKRPERAPTAPSPLFISTLSMAVCLLPLVCSIMPRFMAFGPAVLGLVFYAAYRIAHKQWLPIHRPIAVASGIAVCLALVSSVWSDFGPEVAARALKIIPVFLGGTLFISLLSALRPFIKDTLRRHWLYAVIMAGLLLVIELYCGKPIYTFLRTDYNKPLADAGLNKGIVVFTLSALIAAAFTLQQKKNAPETISRNTSIGIFMMLAVFLGVMAGTENQSVQLATIIAVATYVAFPTRPHFIWKGLGLFLAALVIAAPFLAQYLFKMLPPMVEGLHWFEQSYAAARTEIWDFVSRRALEKPILGHGMDAARWITDFDVTMIYHDKSTVLHPHNFAVQIWLDFGLLGATLMAIGIYAFIQQLSAQAQRHDAKLVLSLFLALLSLAATTYGIWQSWWIGTIFLMGALYTVLSEPKKI